MVKPAEKEQTARFAWIRPPEMNKLRGFVLIEHARAAETLSLARRRAATAGVLEEHL
jgi:hypothetical protein